jgi:ABC-2 type transport system permease protein
MNGFGLRLRSLRLLTRAHLLEFFREPGILFWAFGFPILLSCALGFAFLSPHRSRVVLLVSKTDSVMVRAALPDTASIALRALDGAEALRALRRGEAVGTARLVNGSPVLSVDTNTQEGNLARLLADRANSRNASVGLRVDAPPASSGSYADFLFPGMLALGLMNGCIWGIGFALMDLRLRKLLRLFAATPLARTDILLSVVLARGAILPLENGILWGFGVLVFGVALHGSALLFLAVAASAVVAFAGIGILGASRVEQPQAAYGIINALTIPMTIVSGIFFSWTRFPAWIHPLVGALPLTLAADALRSVSSEGAGVMQVLPKMLGLCAWGIGCAGLGLKLFRWR